MYTRRRIWILYFFPPMTYVLPSVRIVLNLVWGNVCAHIPSPSQRLQRRGWSQQAIPLGLQEAIQWGISFLLSLFLLTLKTKPKANKKPETEIKQTENLEKVSSKGIFRLMTSGYLLLAIFLVSYFSRFLMQRNSYIFLPFKNYIYLYSIWCHICFLMSLL